MLLGSHPDICTVGELKLTSMGDLDKYRCSCRLPIRKCPFWEGIRNDMERKGFPFDIAEPRTDYRSIGAPYVRKLMAPLHRGRIVETVRDVALGLSPAWRKGFPIVQARNVALMECIRDRSGSSVIVDSSKVGLRLKYLLRNDGLDVKVIRLIRDGRGVALSYVDPANLADARNPSLRAGGMAGSFKEEPRAMGIGAMEWRRSNEEAEALLKTLDPSRWTEVRYEDYCRTPQESIRRLFTFLGVDASLETFDFRSVEMHVVGNGMRLDDSSTIRLDERWHESMSEKDGATFEAVAGDLNRSLGYR